MSEREFNGSLQVGIYSSKQTHQHPQSRAKKKHPQQNKTAMNTPHENKKSGSPRHRKREFQGSVLKQQE